MTKLQAAAGEATAGGAKVTPFHVFKCGIRNSCVVEIRGGGCRNPERQSSGRQSSEGQGGAQCGT